jgi:catalase
MAAFSPSTMVPGIAPTADPMLQARMFSYPDAQRYRLGVNYQQLPTNAPISAVYSPYQRDGAANFRGNYGPDPNYVRSSLRPVSLGKADPVHDQWVGKVAAYTSEVTDEDFVQPREFWKVFEKTGQDKKFVHNVSGHLKDARVDVQKEAIKVFAKVDEDLAKRIEAALKA